MAFNNTPDISQAATCNGNACLSELLTSYALKTKGEAALKVGVVGKSHQKAIQFLVLAVNVYQRRNFLLTLRIS